MLNLFHKHKAHTRQGGFSVAELLVAITLGIVVVGAVIQLFVGSRATQMSTSAMANVQENARFAFELIKDEFRGLGSYGFCAGKPTPRNHLNETCPNYNAIYSFASDAHTGIDRWDRPIVGWEYSETGPDESFEGEEYPASAGANQWTMRLTNPDRSGGAETSLPLPGFLEDKVVKGTDVVVVRRMVPVDGLWPAGRQAPDGEYLKLNRTHDLQGRLTMITSCSKSDVFFNTDGADTLRANTGSCGSGANVDPGSSEMWATAYDETAQVYNARIYAYFVGFPGDDEDDESDYSEPGLYRADLSRGADNVQIEELAGGVENLQVLYGYSDPIEGNGETVDYWYTAAEVPLWRYVIAARLSVLMRSSESMGAGRQQEKQSFELGGMTFTAPNDMRMRQLFHLTVGLRNQQVMIERD